MVDGTGQSSPETRQQAPVHSREKSPMLLPTWVIYNIFTFLPPQVLARAACTCKAWYTTIEKDGSIWRNSLRSTDMWYGGESETAFVDAISASRHQAPAESTSASMEPDPWKLLCKSRYLSNTRWLRPDPKHFTFPAHGNSVVTCLTIWQDKIISASDNHSILVFSILTGQLLHALDGHEGGVWSLAVINDILVSGSTDRTVRLWDLSTGRCTHVFRGHTSTVRCLTIVMPKRIDGKNGDIATGDKWPKRPLVISGSRDHTLRVWALPQPGEPGFGEDNALDLGEDTNSNPFHRLHLQGHEHAIRALAACGRTAVSGSYDCTVRVWDIVTGHCKWIMRGHTQKVYSVVLDWSRQQASSGSMDNTIRVWDIQNGTCLRTLSGHTSLVGLLGLSPLHLVSASADASLRIWDPDTGDHKIALAAHTGAITCFQHDEFKLLSGSDGSLRQWNIGDGTLTRELLTGINGVWQVAVVGRWCVAASNKHDETVIDVWDFADDGEDWIAEQVNGMYDGFTCNDN